MWCWGVIDRGGIARPGIGFQRGDPWRARLEGIPMNIPGERQERAILLAQAGVVAPFESGPSWAWPAVIPLGVSAINMAHGAAKIPVRGLKEEMVMMAHQAVPMNHQPQAFMRGGKGIQKGVVVRIGVKDPLPPAPALSHDTTHGRILCGRVGA